MVHAWSVPIGDGLFTVLGFIFSRMVLAVGEARNFPAAIKVTAEYFPKKERFFATGIFKFRGKRRSYLGHLSVPWIESIWGWEAAFLIIGSIGFLRLIFWMNFYEKSEEQTRMSSEELAYIQSDEDKKGESVSQNQASTSWAKLLGYKQTWSFVFGKFMTDGVKLSKNPSLHS